MKIGGFGLAFLLFQDSKLCLACVSGLFPSTCTPK